MKKRSIVFIILTLVLGLIWTTSYAKVEKVKDNGIYKIAIGKDTSKTL